jgi:DNA-binding transcriptional MerR regulator
MLKIGDFAKLSRVSVKALRHYDEMGLLKPTQVDRFTGYRYYSFDQLPRLNRILALKDLGFALEQIAQLLSEELPAAQLRGMLRLRQAELSQHVQGELDQLARVEARLRQIEQEDTMSTYDVVIKSVAPQLVAGVRDTIPTYPQQGHLWKELGAYLNQHQSALTGGPCLTVYYSEEPNIDAEVCEQVSSTLPAHTRVQVHELPGVEMMACVVHHGPFTTIGEAYTAIMKWIEANGYRCIGPVREVYLREAENVSQTDPNTVTEIQFPVEKT